MFAQFVAPKSETSARDFMKAVIEIFHLEQEAPTFQRASEIRKELLHKYGLFVTTEYLLQCWTKSHES